MGLYPLHKVIVLEPPCFTKQTHLPRLIQTSLIVLPVDFIEGKKTEGPRAQGREDDDRPRPWE